MKDYTSYLYDYSRTYQTADSDNNLFGRTLNLHQGCLTAGGSSGGEGAPLAMRGSVIGVGTDMAGSTRIPAYYNGTFSYRLSARRIPYAGQTSSARPGSFSILPSAGPLARSVRGASTPCGMS
jgi:amidase